MSEELKPCPFCEGAAELSEFTSLGSGITTCTVACSGCAAASDIFLIEEKDQAIAAWNRRPAPAAAKAVEMLDAQRLNVLASFAHGIRMGAIKPKDLPQKAREALERTGLLSLDDVVALIDGGNHG